MVPESEAISIAFPSRSRHLNRHIYIYIPTFQFTLLPLSQHPHNPILPKMAARSPRTPSHSRNPSAASHIDLATFTPKSAAAHRMSHTSTLQSASISPRTFFESLLDDHQLILAGVVSSLTLLVAQSSC